MERSHNREYTEKQATGGQDTPISVPWEPSKVPFEVVLIFLTPGPRTPKWCRRFGFSHVVICFGDIVWDQPIKGEGKLYQKSYYLERKLKNRVFTAFSVPGEINPAEMLATLRRLEGRKGQRLRSILRYLHLWPVPAWNCTSPVREILNTMGWPVTKETPDGLIEELARHPRRLANRKSSTD